MKQEVLDLFCGVTSLGIPFPRENKEHISYIDIIEESFIDQNYMVRVYNMSNLNKGRTWDLEKFFMQNYTLAQIKNIQINSINKLKNTNLLFKLIIPPRIARKYSIEPADNDITIADKYRASQKPIFIYAGGTNDFFTFIKAGPIEVISKEVRDNIPQNLEELVIKCVDNVEKNLQLLIELNNSVEIFVLGFYYAPIFDKIQKIIYFQKKLKNKNIKYTNKFLELISLFNKELEKRCSKYPNVKFINIEFIQDACAPLDFHPNTMGNQLIAQAILQKMKFINQKTTVR